MHWQSMMWHWLAYAAVCSCLLFVAAVLAMLATDQPVRRLRIIQWAFVGALLAPFVNELGALPQWHVGLLGSETTAVDEQPAAGGKAIPARPESLPGETGSDRRAWPGRRVAAAPNPRPEPKTSNAKAAGPAVVAASPKPATAPASRPGVEAPLAANADETRIDLPSIILLAYGGIAGGLLLWWVAGLMRLLHLKLSSRPASADVTHEFLRIAGDAPHAKRVRILISHRVPAPLTFGWWRPVIVLPEAVCGPGRQEALRYCLAHEWDHVQRRDILPWHLATMLQVLYFYQPLFWWLRSRMRLCQDYLADAYAADRANVPEDYADFLVQQAKRCSRQYAAALGFAHSKSSLFRRVQMILDEERTIEPKCRKWWSIAIGVIAIGFCAALTSVRLDAAKAVKEEAKPKEESKPAKPQPAKKADAKKVAKAITYNGVVVDRVTQKPISGATVIIDRTLSRIPKGKESWKRTTKVKSDKDGQYSFTLGPDETSEYYLYVEVDCHHPDYVAKGRSGYGHSMIRKNLKMGEQPFYSKIQLWPGKPVTGTLVSPDGKPVKDAQILTYSKHKKAGRWSFGGFYKTYTDAKGRFRFVAATPGEGVYWITPKSFSPQAHMIPEKRGDVGDVVLQHGQVLKGKVIDAKGKPVPNVRVDARRRGDGEDVDRFLGQNAVANHIGRNGDTNKKGEFTLDELPTGGYTISIRSRSQGWAHKPLAQVFLRKSITLRDGEEPAPLEIRAVPHVDVRVKFFNSKGKPRGSHRFHIFCRVDKSYYFTRSDVVDKKTGIGVARIPHGAEKVRVNLMTNEHGVVRWRLKPGQPLKNGREVNLGTLESDHQDLEVVHYTSPILLVKAVDEAGKPVSGFKPKAVYEKGKSPKNPNSRFINGIKGDVYFEKQQDGRWRSNSMMPDQKVAVIAERDGYTTKAQTVSLKEGTSRELVFVLKTKPAGKKPAKMKKTGR